MPNFSELEAQLQKYFPGRFTENQILQFQKAFEACLEWNGKINVISRKDLENLAERHFLYSLAIAKHLQFKPGTRVLDAGTGGGFPGIPLAICFPETTFHLVDSRNKKIKVVQEIVQATGLKNVQSSSQRVEDLSSQYDFVVSRAVAPMNKFIPWVRKKIHCRSRHKVRNGILYLRGAATPEELGKISGKKGKWNWKPVSEYYEGEFFETKFLLHVSFC